MTPIQDTVMDAQQWSERIKAQQEKVARIQEAMRIAREKGEVQDDGFRWSTSNAAVNAAIADFHKAGK
jgi:hypothetical protein